MNDRTIPSIRALARLVDRSHVAVARWIRHSAWTFGRPPWPSSIVPAVKLWMATELRSTGADETPVTAEEIAVIEQLTGQTYDEWVGDLKSP